ncbi:PD-(D/E)XK nuclease family protein [Candidatus Kaiserbacteria bacterium]|nr:PD-(D/E)XK nuclease family protein [Candidatus Kaiserbacteria bacterium]
MPFLYKVRGEKFCFDPERNGPKGKTPFAISRSKIDLFHECPRCFYLDQRHGIKRPDGYPFSLNVAVDELLKKEFDLLRKEGKPHALMREYGIDALPFKHKDLDLWRDSLRNGIKYHDPVTNLVIRGGVDDVWIGKDGALHIVDYKATSKNGEVSLDAEWQDGYKRQVEVYQWLFRKNDFKVSDIAYFVYANGDTSPARFDARLEFVIKIIPYTGDDAWIPKTITALHACLMAETAPDSSPDCTYCAYRSAAGKQLQKDAPRRRKDKTAPNLHLAFEKTYAKNV